MKRIFALIMFAAAFCITGTAKTSNEVIRDIRTNNKALTIRFNKLMMALLPDLKDEAFGEAMGHISSGTIVTVEDGGEKARRSFLESVSELDTCKYQPFVSVNDEDGETVQIFGRMKKGYIREVLVVVASDDDCTLIRLKGKLTQEDIRKIVARND